MFVFTISMNCLAQFEARHWCFGYHTGLDFHNGSSTPTKITTKIGGNYSATSISDAYGNLLLYSNGSNVWNGKHNYVKNGTGLNCFIFQRQGALLLPHPGDSDYYYLFTSHRYPAMGFYYHLIDKSSNNGNGEVVLKNKLLFHECHNGKMGAVNHADNKSIWVVVAKSLTPSSNSYYSYLLSKTGLDTTPVISNVGLKYPLTYGYLKFSPDGKKVVITTHLPDSLAGFQICDFNNRTGKLSNPIIINDGKKYMGAEFSPNCKLLYISVSGGDTTQGKYDSLFQFDVSILKKENILASKCFLGNYYAGGKDGHAEDLQLAINHKIYVSGFFTEYLGVINSPNKPGLDCDFKKLGQYVQQSYIDLPDFLQSYFFLPDIKTDKLCFGDSTHLSISDTSKVDSVFWNMGDPNSGISNYSTLIKPSHLFSDTGKYIIFVCVWHDQGEKDTLSREIYIAHKPQTSFYIADSSQCVTGNKFYFFDSSTIASGTFDWTWDFGDSTKSYIQHPKHNYGRIDTYKVTLTVISDYGCRSHQTKKVYVNPMPKAIFTLNDTIACFSDQHFEVNNLSSVIRDTITQNYWFLDSISLSNSIIPNLSDSLYTGKHTLELITSTTHGCTDTTSNQFVVHPVPTAKFSISDSIQCFNENLTLFKSLTEVKNLSGLNYKWDFGDNTTSTDTHTLKSFSHADTFIVQLLAISPNNCKDSVTKQIVVLESPKAEIGVNDSSQCLFGNEFHFFKLTGLNQAVRLNYSWEFGDSTQSQDSSPVKTYLNTDTFLVSLILTTDFDCKDTAYREVFVRPMPLADFYIDNPYQCLVGNNFNFSNSSKISSGLLNYTWFLNDSLLGTSQHYNNLTIKQYGNKNIKLLAESDYHCLDSVQKNIFVNPMPIADFSYSIPCFEKEIQFSDKSQIPQGSINNWKWYFTSNDSSALQHPVFVFNNQGDHHPKLIAHSDSGCVDTVSKTITIYGHAPAVELERVSVVNDKYNLLEWKDPASPIVSAYQIQKSTNFGNFADFKTYPKDSLHLTDFAVFPDQSIYTYQLLTEDSCGHISEPSNIAQTILLQLDSSETFSMLTWSAYEDWKQGIQRYEVQVFNNQSLNWEKVESSIYPVSFIDSITKLSQSNYCYRIAAFRNNDELQSNSNVVCVDTRMNLFVPNAFSPNGDGINDHFQIKGVFIKEFNIQIFNRWGEKLFESDSINDGWDGSFKGKTCAFGTYYYSITAKGANGKSNKLSGSLHLLR